MKLIKKHRTLLIVAGLFLTALFLRVYRLPEFIAYHQDQVRDLIYVKEHLDAGKFILLGPKASVADFYLAPFWYYLMGFTHLFSQSPVAPAFMVALLNSSATVILYFFTATFFSPATAIIASLLYATSPFSIEYSRFAWNPNPIPFFSILAIYSLFVYLYRNRPGFLYLAVAAANLTFQLHYQGFLLVAVVFIFPIIRKDWKRLFVSGLIFVGLLAPFIYFEATNGYPNLTQIISFLAQTTRGRTLGIGNSFKALTIDYPEFIARTLFFGNKPLGQIFSIVTFFLTLKNMIKLKFKEKWTPNQTIYAVFSVLLLTLFAYRQWIVPYYLLVALIPLIIITVLAFGRMKYALLVLVLVNLALSPSFTKTDSSLKFFEKSVILIQRSGVSKNCVEYLISDSNLKFAANAVDYLMDFRDYSYPEPNSCNSRLVFCQTDLCDKIKGDKMLESNFLGLSLIER